MKAVAEEL